MSEVQTTEINIDAETTPTTKSTEVVETKAEVKQEKEEATTEVVEEKEEAKSEEKEDEDPKFSSRFAALSKKEKILSKKEKETKENFLKSKKALELQELIDTVETDPEAPFKIFDKLGIDSVKLAQKLVDMNGQGEEVPLLEKKISEFEKKFQEQEAQIAKILREKEEATQNAEIEKTQSRIQAFKAKTKADLIAKGDEYEIINTQGLHDEVFKKMEQHYAKTKEVLAPEIAAREVEKEQEAIAQKYLQIKKLKLKQEEVKVETKPEEKKEPKKEVTLTNTMTPTLGDENPYEGMSETERQDAIFRKYFSNN